MSTPQDPFAAPASGGIPPAPGAVPPPAPGVIPGAVPVQTTPGYAAPVPPQPGQVPHPPYGSAPSPHSQYPHASFPTQQYGQPQPPKTLALWTIILTGAVTALTLLSSVLVLVDFDNYKQGLVDSLTDPTAMPSIGASDMLSYLISPIMLASYILLALWMQAIRKNLTALGRAPGGVPAVEWWGWFVPLANFILPALGMRSITRRSVGIGALILWWVGFCAYWVASYFPVTISFALIDFTTGEFNGNYEALDALAPTIAIQAVALLISWVFLTILVSKTTAKHLHADDTVTATFHGA